MTRPRPASSVSLRLRSVGGRVYLTIRTNYRVFTPTLSLGTIEIFDGGGRGVSVRMSGCPFKHPAVSKLLAAALISVVGGVFRAATTQYRSFSRFIRLQTLSRIAQTA